MNLTKYIQTRLTEFSSVLLIATGVALAVLPIVLYGIPLGPDTASHIRFAVPFTASLYNHNFAPAWQNISNSGYGDGSFRIYSPGIYYIFAVVQRLTANWFSTFLWSFGLLVLTSATAMYYWMRSAGMSAVQSGSAALIYVLSPFHNNELYQSAMIAQYAGGPLLALTFAAIEQLCGADLVPRKRIGAVVLFAVAFGLLVYTHIVLTIMGAIAIPFYVVIRTNQENWKRTFASLAVGLVLGLGLSASYWTKLVAELPWVKGATIHPGLRFNYSSHFLFTFSSTDGLSVWYPSVLGISTLALCAIPWLTLYRANPLQRRWLAAVSVVAAFSFLMCTIVSAPLWALIPKLASIEFPWRWLAVMNLCGCAMAGASVPSIAAMFQSSRFRSLGLIALGLLAAAIAVTVSYPIRNATFLTGRAFNTLVATVVSERGLEEWLPYGADPKVIKQSDTALARSETDRTVQITEWAPETRRIRIEPGPSSKVRIRTFYYPLWRAMTASGMPLSTGVDPDGTLTVSVPQTGAQDVVIYFQRPVRETIANASSLMFLLFLVAAAIYSCWSVRVPPTECVATVRPFSNPQFP